MLIDKLPKRERERARETKMGGKKHVIKQKRVSKKDKCRFGLGIYSSMRLQYGQHIDSCMNM